MVSAEALTYSVGNTEKAATVGDHNKSLCMESVARKPTYSHRRQSEHNMVGMLHLQRG